MSKQGSYGKVRIHTHSLISQISHIDEIVVALGFKLGILTPVKVSPIVNAHPSFVYCEKMLGKVSRSFAMVIQQLPLHLRKSVCVFYLVLRGLDTVEDDMDTFKGKNTEKINILRTFHTFLTQPDWKLEKIGEGDERILLENFFHVNTILLSLTPKDSAIIIDICRRMGAGMADFSVRDMSKGTNTLEEYNLYCHHVAGLVGEGLTQLFVVHGDESAQITENPKLADDMGLFLQKTNIIRDYLEDLADGRSFWPREIWSLYSKNLHGLTTQNDKSLECLNHMIADALSLAPSCILYLQTIRDPDIFKFCAIPQVMAIATLSHIVNNPDVFTGVVKIRKGEALLLMSKVNKLEDVHSIFSAYTHNIMNSIPRRHRAASTLADKAAKEIEGLCGRVDTGQSSYTIDINILCVAIMFAFILLYLSGFCSSTVALNAILCILYFWFQDINLTNQRL